MSSYNRLSRCKVGKHKYSWDGAHEYVCDKCCQSQNLCQAEDAVARLEQQLSASLKEVDGLYERLFEAQDT